MTVYELRKTLEHFHDNDRVVLDLPTFGLFRVGSVTRGVNEHDGLVYISPTPIYRCPYCGRTVSIVYLEGDGNECECECNDCEISFIIKEKI